MQQLARSAWTMFGFGTPRPQALREPEAINAQKRPMKGLFASLSESDKAFVRSYCGEENHGDTSFARRK